MSHARLLYRLLRGGCVLLGVFWVTASSLASQANTHPIQSQGSTELRFKRSDGEIVRVTLWQAKTQQVFPYREPLMWGGDVNEVPKIFLSSIQVQDGKE